MNGFLVVLRHMMDDLPVGLFETRAEAVAYAKAISPMPGEWDKAVFNIECQTPISVFVAEFRDCFAKSFVMVRDFEDEGDDEFQGVPEKSLP